MNSDPEKNGKLNDLGVRISNEKEEQNRLVANAKPKTKKASAGVSFKEDPPYVPAAMTMSTYFWPTYFLNENKIIILL